VFDGDQEFEILDARAILRFAFHVRAPDDRKDRNAEFKGRRLSHNDPASMTVTMMTVNRWREQSAHACCTRCKVKPISARAHGAIIAVDCTACHDARAGGRGGGKKRSPLRGRVRW
jgi:hypothetical protein